MIKPEGVPRCVWELDAAAACVARIGKVSLNTILDVMSHLKIESYACLDTINPLMEAYQLMFRHIKLAHWPIKAHLLRSRNDLL